MTAIDKQNTIIISYLHTSKLTIRQQFRFISPVKLY